MIRLPTKEDAWFENRSPCEISKQIQDIETEQSYFGNATQYKREWLPAHPVGEGSEITMIQLNMLAQGLSSGPQATPPFTSIDPSKKKVDQLSCFGGFENVSHPELSLDFDKRKWRLLQIMLGYENYQEKLSKNDNKWDIIALQECDAYESFFKPALSKFSYSSIFYPKESAPGLKLGYYSDGCALFFNNTKFRLISHVKGKYSVGSQIYIIATLKHIETGCTMVVATTHLKAKNGHDNERIRTSQAKELCEEAAKIVYNIQRSCCKSVDVPLVILGDFNAELPKNNDDNQGYDSNKSACIRSILHRKEAPFMKSVYPTDPASPELYTTYKTRKGKTTKRTIDYIFYNGGKGEDKDEKGKSQTVDFKCTHFLQAPNIMEVSKSHMPGFRNPSDHIHLGAKFCISSNIRHKTQCSSPRTNSKKQCRDESFKSYSPKSLISEI